mgnify:FL=1
MKLLRLFAASSIALIWALVPLAANADEPSLHDQRVAAQTQVNTLESQLSAAQTQLNIDTQTVLSDSATVILAKSELDSATAAYQASAVTETTTTGAAIHVDVYNQAYHRSRPDGVFCRQDTFTVIANNWGGGSVAGCNGDYVLVHYYGTISVPITDTYQFKNIADDGFYMTLNNQVVIDEWRDKGCNGNWGAAITLQAGVSYPFDAWYYEWGGGACSTLYYQSSTNWAQVPSSWYGTTTVTTTYDPALAAVVQQKQAAYNAALSTYNSSVAKVSSDNSTISQIQSDLQTARSTLAAIPYLNTPTNLQVDVDTSTATVHLTWSAPDTSNASVLTYAISWSTSNFTSDGWGWTHDQTSVDIPFDIFNQSSGWNKNIQFKIRADNNTLMLYSEYSTSVEKFIPDPTPPPSPPQIPDTSTVTTETQTVVVDTTTVVDTATVTPETVTVVETATSQSQGQPPVPPAPPAPVETPSQEPTPVVVPPRPVVQPVDPAPAVDPSTPSDADNETPIEPDPSPTEEPVDPLNDPSLDVPIPLPTDTTDTQQQPDQQTEPTPQVPADTVDDTVDQTSDQSTQEDPVPTDAQDGTQDTTPVVVEETQPSTEEIQQKVTESVQSAFTQPTALGKPLNGGVQFFGTQEQPQVIDPDTGKITPPPPPPGSGLPIPPEAITVAETFIGQPGGVGFNSPDVAVPLEPIEVNIEIPGVGQAAQAMADAYVAMANIGADMAPTTRKKAKKIILATVVASGAASMIRRP